MMVGHTPAVALAWDLADPLGVRHIAELPTAEPWLIDRFAERAAAPASGSRAVAVLGGRGGAGASILAITFALSAHAQAQAPAESDVSEVVVSASRMALSVSSMALRIASITRSRAPGGRQIGSAARHRRVLG